MNSDCHKLRSFALRLVAIGAGFEDRTTIAFARGLSELVGGFVAPPGYAN